MTHELLVYGRPDCHLCSEMVTALARLQPELGFRCQVLDVDTDPELVRSYGSRVPVLVAGNTELCCHFLDEERLREYFLML